MRLSHATGIPSSVVEGNFDTIKAEEHVRSVDFGKLSKNYPSLSRWLGDINNAGLGKDDIPNLQKVEDVIKDRGLMSSLWDSFGYGLTQAGASLTKVPGLAADVFTQYQNLKSRGANLALEAVGSEERLPMLKTPDFFLENDFVRSYEEKARAMGQKIPELSESVFDEIASGNFARAGRVALTQAVSNAPNLAVMMAMARTGLQNAALGYAGVTTAAESAAENKSNPNLSPEAGLANAAVKGAAEAVFERIGTILPLKHWETAITNASGKQVTREVFKDLFKTMLYTTGMNFTEEALTSGAQDLTDYYTGANPDALKGIEQRMFDAGAVGAVTGAGIVSPGASMVAVDRQIRIRRTEETKNFYTALGESIEATKLRTRLPEAQRALVDEIVKDSPVENIYISTEAVEKYFQGPKGNPTKTMQELGVLEAFEEAKTTGGDVKIPLATWTDKVVGTEHYQGLANDIKFNPEDFSVNEAKVAEKELETQLQAESKAATENTDTAGLVGDSVAAQLEAAGFPKEQAVLYESGFRALGQRTGMDPKALFDQYKLRITADSQELSNDTEVLFQKAKRTRTSNVVDASERFGRREGATPEAPLFTDLSETYAALEEKVSRGGFVSKSDLNTINARLDEILEVKETTDAEDVLNNLDAELDRIIGILEPSKNSKSSPLRLLKQSSVAELDRARIQKEFEAEINAPEKVEQYNSDPETFGGKKLDTDIARWLIASYAESRENRILHTSTTQSPAGNFIWNQFLEKLKAPATGPVLLMSGGGASGKSSALMTNDELAEIAEEADIIYDSVLPNLAQAEERIQMALDSGRPVSIAFVYRPLESAAAGMVERFKRVGRYIPSEVLVRDHIDAQETFLAIAKKYSDNPAVHTTVYDNSGDVAQTITIDELAALRYIQESETKEEAAKRILPSIKEITSEVEQEVRTVQDQQRDAREASGVRAEAGQGSGEQSEQGSQDSSGNPLILNQSAVPQPQIAPTFYSKLTQLIEQKMSNSAPVAEVRSLAKDIKEEERKWSGFDEFLKGKERVSKAELLEFLRANQLQVVDVTKGGNELDRLAITTYGTSFSELSELQQKTVKGMEEGHAETKFSQYVLPGGENYREVLFTLPDKDVALTAEKQRAKEEYLELERKIAAATKKIIDQGGDWQFADSLAVEEGLITAEDIKRRKELREKANAKQEEPGENYRSSHWDEANVLAHVRLNDRVDADGKRVLFVEEIQSDWHQAGRKKGYKDQGVSEEVKSQLADLDRERSLQFNKLKDSLESVDFLGFDRGTEAVEALWAARDDYKNQWDLNDAPESVIKNIDAYLAAREKQQQLKVKFDTALNGVPDAPFRKTWHEFALKRIIRLAAEGGYDRVAWTTGEQQAERYDLSKQIDRIVYSPSKSRLPQHKGTYNIIAYAPNGRDALGGGMMYQKTPEQLEEIVGKEITQKILAGEGKPHKEDGVTGERVLSGLDLKVGGEGMKGFYDKIVPDFLRKFTKKYGASVGETSVAGTGSADRYRIDQNEDSGLFYVLDEETDQVIDERETRAGAEKLVKRLQTREQSKVHSLEITPQLREAALYEGFSLFQPGEDGPRGQIGIGSGGMEISLLKSADLSTFLHETGHFYLEVMKDLASKDNAPLDIKDDYATILGWVGAQPGTALSIEQHEMFARGFEAYLMEGNAPSPALRSAFARFRVWLITVYRQLRNLDVELTDEVRGVLDRLLATSEEIDAAQASVSMNPLFTDPESMGLRGEKLERYLRARDEARSAAEEELSQKLFADFKREKESWWTHRRGEMLSAIDESLGQRRVYKALSILQRGKLPDGSPLPEGMPDLKISKEALVKLYGKEFLKKLPRPYVYSAKGGLHPDIVAQFLGYESGDQMITEMVNAPKRDVLAGQMADQQMREAYPDLITNGELQEEALHAVHNEKRTQLLRLELEHLASSDMPTLKEVIRKVVRRVPTDKMVREQATKIVGSRSVKDLSPIVFQRAEAKAAKEAGEALAKGDIDGAFAAKSRELLNHELYRATVKARQDVETAIENFKKVSRPDEKLSKTRDIDLVNAARAVLADYGLGRSDDSAESHLAQIKAYDPEVYQTIGALVDSVSKTAGPYKTVKYDDFVAMRDTVFALWDLSKANREIEIDGLKMDRDLIVEELKVALGNLNAPDRLAGYKRAVSEFDKAKMLLEGLRARLRRVESWVDAIDGGDINGVFRRYIWNPISEATNKYRDGKRDILNKYLNVVTAVEPSLTPEEIAAPELGYTFKGKQELLGALLHTGNESNLSKLLRGRGWGEFDLNGSLDTSRWDNFIRRLHSSQVLTKADWDFVQGVWDLLEEVKPSAQKAHKQMYGYYFNEITAGEIVTPFGTYRGGYMPAVADPFIAEDAQVREEKAIIENLNNSFMFPTTGRGFTKKRVEMYARPLALDLALVPSHIDKVMRFVHIEPHVKEVGRIIMDHGFRDALGKVDNTVQSAMLVPWLQRSAQQKIETPSEGKDGRGFDAFWRAVRNRTGLQIMTANFVNTFQQVVGVSIAAVKVRPKYLRNALWTYMRSPKKVGESIATKSAFMRNRLTAHSLEIQGQIEEMLLNPNKYEQAREFAKKHGYFLQSGAQSVVDTVVWVGAYDEAVAGGLNEVEAVRTADSAVRLTQGSFAAEDVSKFETGSPFVRLFTMFYSYFNMWANLLGTEFTKTLREQGLRKGAGRLLYIYTFAFMIPCVVSEVIVRSMAGELDADDDDEYLDDAMSIFFSSQFRSLSAMVPGVGPLFQAGLNATDEKWFNDRISTSPAVAMIESAVVGNVSNAYNFFTDEKDVSTRKAAKDFLTLMGLLTGVPLAPLAKPIGYLSDIAEGNAQPTGAADFARGFVTGRPGTQ
jgi:hypothetical protein